MYYGCDNRRSRRSPGANASKNHGEVIVENQKLREDIRAKEAEPKTVNPWGKNRTMHMVEMYGLNLKENETESKFLQLVEGVLLCVILICYKVYLLVAV